MGIERIEMFGSFDKPIDKLSVENGGGAARRRKIQTGPTETETTTRREMGVGRIEILPESTTTTGRTNGDEIARVESQAEQANGSAGGRTDERLLLVLVRLLSDL